MKEIQKSIREGRYTLSPLKARPLSQLTISSFEGIIIHAVDDLNNLLSYEIDSTEEDKLVLIALGLMLNKNLAGYLMDNSMGFKIPLKYYYDLVCARENVLKLYRFDLTNSFRFINRDILLCKLSVLVMDNEIMKYVKQYLYLPILTESGIDLSDNFSIPPTGSLFISSVLLNFALMDFDQDFQLLFPHLAYNRYANEVLVSFSSSESNEGMTFQDFEAKVVSLFEKSNLYGKILSIGPGDGPIQCLSCMLSVR